MEWVDARDRIPTPDELPVIIHEENGTEREVWALSWDAVKHFKVTHWKLLPPAALSGE